MDIEKTYSWEAGKGEPVPAWAFMLTGFFFIMGLAMLAGAFFAYKNGENFAESAMSTQGTVIDLARKRSEDRHQNTSSSIMYSPVVQFVDQKGKTHTFEDRSSSNPPAYRRGEKVTVLYEPDNPEFALIDGWRRYLTSLILGGMGLGFSLFSLFFMWLLRKEAAKKAVKPVPKHDFSGKGF